MEVHQIQFIDAVVFEKFQFLDKFMVGPLLCNDSCRCSLGCSTLTVSMHGALLRFQLLSELVVALGIWTVFLRVLCLCSSAFAGQVLLEEFGRFFGSPRRGLVLVCFQGLCQFILHHVDHTHDVKDRVHNNNQQPTTNNQQPTTNNQQPTTNNQQPTTNNQQPTTNNKQQTTNNKQQTTNNKQQTTNNKTTNNKQQTTNNKQQTTNNKQQTTTGVSTKQVAHFSCEDLCAEPLRVTMAFVARDTGTSAARRRRERRLRSMLRHERMTVAMALAEFTHHAALRRPMMARARGEESEMNNAMGQTTPPPQGGKHGAL